MVDSQGLEISEADKLNKTILVYPSGKHFDFNINIASHVKAF